MDEDFSALRNGLSDPVDHAIEVHSYVFLRDVLDVQHLIFEMVGVEWIHSSHRLQDVSDSICLQPIEVLSSMNVSNEQFW